jgi:DNA-3-methyladenine glycosylase I
MTNGAKTDLFRGADGRRRCFWCASAADYVAYHDAEWGFPVRDDRRLFEKLCLEGFQSGLSWLTILRKREGFRRAFAGFDFEKVARFSRANVRALLRDEGIVRHRGKIEATIQNAKRACDVTDEFGSFATYIWQWEPRPSSRPKRINRAVLATMTTSPEATAMSKDLKRRGFAFVGPTTSYAFMQAMGLANDHIHGCFIQGEVERARRAFRRPAAAQ